MKKLITVFCILCSVFSPAFGANEIRSFEPGTTTCYAVVREVDGDVWYVAGQVFEAWGTGARTAADYDIALTDKTGGMFVGNMDTNISAGYYYIVTHYQVGGSPADTDPPVWQDYGYWDTSAWTSGPDSSDIDTIIGKLPTNYIMGSSNVDDHDITIHAGTVPDNTSTENSIKLAATASGSNDNYNENLITLISGTGAGQARLIADYVGAVQTAAVRDKWLITPDNTTKYRITPFSGILLSNTGLAVAATADTITLNASATTDPNTYVGSTIFISGGTGAGQPRLITDYTADRVATVSPAWDTIPAAAGSVYLILPVGRTYVDVISSEAGDVIAENVVTQIDANSTIPSSIAALNDLSAAEVNAEVDTALADYEPPTKTEMDSGFAALNDITVAEVWDAICEGTYSYKDYMRLLASKMFWKSSGGGTTTHVYKGADGTTTRITETIDANGNRTSITVDADD